MARTSEGSSSRVRFGIGEWYGLSFVSLTDEQRRQLSAVALKLSSEKEMPCIPRGGKVRCTKAGGVCSLRMYHEQVDSGEITVVPGQAAGLVTMCPYRFLQDGLIFEWIGSELLKHPEPVVVGEVGFLEREAAAQGELARTNTRDDVGRIDNILLHPTAEPLRWCAMEIQAVYFSGPGMGTEFRAILDAESGSLPFPIGKRRPDFRSSGPKRLMPQLQIKVPALRRWGKKMAVVVDESFFSSLGTMDSVPYLSNCDIAWFVVRYEESAGKLNLARSRVHLTTLERAVEGLTAGHAVSLELFETRIRKKLERGATTDPASVDLDL